ncbi:MAG: hypothetical protein Q8M29_08240 [Bacteroidota bacterium]|nr:hypothetical protein [Bacteroidota bacterium]
MEELEEQIPLNKKGEETVEFKKSTQRHSPGLRALLSVKHFTATLETDYTELLQIEGELHELNLNALLIIEANILPEAAAGWKVVIPEINKAVTGINVALTSAKEKSGHKEKTGNHEFWKQLTDHLTELKNNSKNAANTGLTLLPEKAHPQWEKEFVKLEAPLMESLIAHVESCRILLQMIERYTPDELNAITQIIADHVPLNFTYEEAMEYQNDYYKALINFKKEFKQEKNLWDKFLDILAGGTHQSPSERVMMERWLDGEKGDL